ncbi:MAG TPA: histidine kinase [bacterium]|nr:histidine kinase [bacterium]
MSSIDAKSPPLARRADDALAEHEERFLRLAENASDIIFRLRFKPVHAMEYVNPALTAITGYTPEEAYADPELARTIVHPEDRAMIEAVKRDTDLMRTSLTFRLVRKDGEHVWVERRVIPITDAAGEIVAIEGIVRDITQHVLTQQTLEQSVEDRTQELARRQRVADGMRETLAVLNSDRPIAEILDHIVGQTIRLLGAGAAAVYGIEPDGKTLRIRSARGLDPDYVARMSIDTGMGPSGEAVMHRRPVAVPDLAAGIGQIYSQLDPVKQTLLARLARQFRSLITVPLIVKGDAYGALVVYYRESGEFSTEEIGVTEALGDQAALAIENARLRAHLQEAAVAAERNRLARDLHDSVSQTLFSVNLIANVLPRLWERDPEEGRQRLAELSRLSRGALAEMRSLLLELRPAALLEMPLGDLLQQLAETTTARSRLPISVHADGRDRVPPDVHVTFYRIAQEALNNVVKHAEAGRCAVTVRWSADSARLVVDDDGRGFDPNHVARAHLGLGIMRERAEGIGAAVRVRTGIKQGTTVELDWPGTSGAGPAAIPR